MLANKTVALVDFGSGSNSTIRHSWIVRTTPEADQSGSVRPLGILGKSA